MFSFYLCVRADCNNCIVIEIYSRQKCFWKIRDLVHKGLFVSYVVYYFTYYLLRVKRLHQPLLPSEFDNTKTTTDESESRDYK